MSDNNNNRLNVPEARDLYHCPYMERIYDVKEYEDDSYD